MRTTDKAQVVRALRELASYLQLSGENAFKVRAYEVAAERLAGLSDDFEFLVAEGRLTDLPGIGESIAKKITEMVERGSMATLDELKARFPPKILELLEVQDLGPRKAQVLYEQLGVGSIDDLERACRAQQVRGLKGFGQKTEEKLLAHVELARRQLQAGSRKRLGDVLGQAHQVLEWVQRAPGVSRASLGGSVRRRRETVADVDVIASAPDASTVFAHFLTFPQVATVLAKGESKCSVRLRETDLQVDLRVLPEEDFATALHHFTGSKAHHIKLRALALERGLTISEWGLYRTGDQLAVSAKKGTAKHELAGEKLPIADERQLYALLGMQYVPPELREDWGEIEAALAHSLPDDLVSLEDIKGNVHVHTTWSDGRNSLEEMALAAQALGMRYLTITEHSQSSHYAGGMSVDQLTRQGDEIDQLNQKLEGITLLKGIECDILEDGRLDYPDQVLEKLDIVIGSIHQRFGQDEAAMTKRVLAAFDNPHLQIWGHPTGRLLLKREPVPLRMEEVLDKAASRGIVIEVNGQPERLDLSAEHLRGALRRKIKLVVSTDAHSVEELKTHLPYAVCNAQRGWARRGDVVNTLELNAFRAALRRG